MNAASTLTDLLVKAGIALLLANEVRGFVLAAPVLYTMYESGGTWMALWVGFCSLAGIALSVIVPLYAARRLNLLKPGEARYAIARIGRF